MLCGPDLSHALQHLLEDDCLVVIDVLCRKDERKWLVPPDCEQLMELVLSLVEFGAVALLELGPTRRVMAEPFAQLGGRSDVLCPMVDRRLFLRYAARPDAVDQNTKSVLARRRLVDTLDGDLPHFIFSESDVINMSHVRW